MFQTLLLTLVIGQCPSSPTVVITQPPLYIAYNLGGMTEVTRCMEVITYDDGRRWRVPIINGYLPAITHTRYSDGAERYYFDYRINLTYSDYLARQREKELARLPGPVPDPIPERPRPTPAPLLEVQPKKRPVPLLEKMPVPELELEPSPLVPVFPPQTMDLPEPKRRIIPSYDR